jgi:hypothetical protein
MKEQPNNWLAVYETPHQFFPEISYDDFYEFHIANWMLPSSHECIIRATSLKDGRVQEFNYRYRGAAENKIKQLLGTHEFVVCDHEAIHKLTPNPQRYKDDNKD